MRIEYRPKAIAQMNAFDSKIRKRIADKMRFYADQQNPITFAKHLTDRDAYRFRIGNYRAICDVNKNTIAILLVAKRDGAYKDL